MSKKVIIIGGGIAGLSAGVFLSREGYNITILEQTNKLGGRLFSYYDKNLNTYLDNGQHILAGWYKDTFDFLNEIGTFEKLKIKENFKVTLLDKFLRYYNFETSETRNKKLNIIRGILNYKPFKLSDKIAFLKLLFSVNKKNFPYKDSSLKEILDSFKFSGSAMKFFWEPFSLAVFNTISELISVSYFRQIIEESFINNIGLIIPETDLKNLFIDNAERYFIDNNVKVIKSKKIHNINVENQLISSIETEDKEYFDADLYISAIPHNIFKSLFCVGNLTEYFKSIHLKSSSIISINLVFKTELPYFEYLNQDSPMLGLIDSTIQWVFWKSKKCLSLIISGVDYIDELKSISNEKLFDNAIVDLKRFNPSLKKSDIENYKIIKEKNATFVPDIQSLLNRPDVKTEIENLFLAGDWVNTGLPSTIESAIRSARMCREAVMNESSI